MWERCVQCVLHNSAHTHALHRTQLRYCLNFIGQWGRWSHVECPAPCDTPAQLKRELRELCVRAPSLVWVLRASVVRRPNGLQRLVMRRLSDKLQAMPVLWYVVHCFRTLVWAQEYGCVPEDLATCIANVVIQSKSNKALVQLLQNANAGCYDALTC